MLVASKNVEQGAENTLFLLRGLFLMREASSKRDCLSVCPSVCVCVCMSHFFTNFFLREKVHIVSARDISTFLCVEMTMCLKFWDIVSARVIFTFSDIDSERDMLSHALTHIHSRTHTHTHTHTNTHTRTHTHTHMHTHKHIHKHKHIFTHKHTHTHTYTCTHTQMKGEKWGGC